MQEPRFDSLDAWLAAHAAGNLPGRGARGGKAKKAKKVPKPGDCWTETVAHASGYPDRPGTGELQVEVKTFHEENGARADHFGVRIQCSLYATGTDKVLMVKAQMDEIPMEFLDALPTAIAAAIATGRRAGILPKR